MSDLAITAPPKSAAEKQLAKAQTIARLRGEVAALGRLGRAMKEGAEAMATLSAMLAKSRARLIREHNK